MKVFVGVDLGSTTTKAVVMTEREEILGRGITNSRSNYDVACAVARAEAFTTARFALLCRALAAAPDLARLRDALAPDLERLFRREQHERQLAVLREACLSACGAAEDRGALEEIFAGMREQSEGLFGAGAAPSRSDFFRDLAASQYLRLAEAAARRGRARFEKLVSLFDMSIHRVENAPPDLSFESNIRAAAARAAGAATPGADGTGAVRAVRAGRLEAAIQATVATPLEEAGSVGTGYGRARLPFPRDRIRSEILCHGLGAHYFFPRTATVLDIGGQDTKAIQIDAEGIVTGFQMNDRCAAGCGRYLGYIADEMSLGVHELGPLAQQSCRPARIASTCTVFAGAELRDRLALGERREDILAGLHRAIILRSMSLLARSGGVREQFAFTGGVARNPAALAALRHLVQENYGARTTNVSPDSIYTGAVGAALFARRAAGQRQAA
ncbi:MAG: benzoyl-CoA reductase subunit A [Acidobacteria bacterium]|nr:benzoyl-CoA reductase subunit A [Acidobacteriota bacterium]